MSKFQVGDKVTQSAVSRWRHGSEMNPVDVTGVVVDIREGRGLPVQVEWPNAKRNSYEEEALDLVAPTIENVLVSAKRLQELRAQQAELSKEITELAEQIKKALEGSGLVLQEDITLTTTLRDLVDAGEVKIGDAFLCQQSADKEEHVEGKVYSVVDLDQGDSLPVKLQSEDGHGWWVAERYLQNYIKAS